MAYVSEWQQAEYIARAFEIGQAWEQIGPMILWNLNFAPTFGTKYEFSGYSILRTDGTTRPAYWSIQSLFLKENRTATPTPGG